MRDSKNSRSIHDAAQWLADIDPNFNIRDSEASDPDCDPLNPDPDDKDPEAKRRHTVSRNKSADGLRPALINKAFRAYMTRGPKKWSYPTTKAVRLIFESWIDRGWAKRKGFERTIYRALGLRREKN